MNEEMTRYTFAVCKLCGVQSPPILNPRNMEMQLKDMGWKLDTMKFTILATCPTCQNEK